MQKKPPSMPTYSIPLGKKIQAEKGFFALCNHETHTEVAWLGGAGSGAPFVKEKALVESWRVFPPFNLLFVISVTQSKQTSSSWILFFFF